MLGVYIERMNELSVLGFWQMDIYLYLWHFPTN